MLKDTCIEGGRMICNLPLYLKAKLNKKHLTAEQTPEERLLCIQNERLWREKNKKPPSFVQDENKCQKSGEDFSPPKRSQLWACPGVTAAPEVLMQINSVSWSFLTTSAFVLYHGWEWGCSERSPYSLGMDYTQIENSNLRSNFFYPLTEVPFQEQTAQSTAQIQKKKKQIQNY